MLAILLILIMSLYVAFLYPIFKPKKEEAPDQNSRYARQMKKLWSVAQTSMRERKPLRAEKALLTILKFDEKNAAAYNRLGILYAKEQKFNEAIECFEIAQSLDNNASSLHNAGLIYLETGAYEKAAMAFEQAIKLEGDVPARFIALAKSYENLGRKKDALENLESAYSLNPTLTTLRQILALHEASGDAEAVAATTARIEEQMAANAKARAAKKQTAPARPRRLTRRPAQRQVVNSTAAPRRAAAPRTQRSTPLRSTASTTPRRSTVQPRRSATTRQPASAPRQTATTASRQTAAAPARPTAVSRSNGTSKPKSRRLVQ